MKTEENMSKLFSDTLLSAGCLPSSVELVIHYNNIIPSL